jgi:hypothetical protein
MFHTDEKSELNSAYSSWIFIVGLLSRKFGRSDYL